MIIIPSQSREARRELGISQADVASAISVNRVYVSDFESGNLIRLTNAQLRKLRAFYEVKIEEARANGDEIDLAFGEKEAETATPRIETFSAKQFAFPVGKDVSDEVIAATLTTIGQIDKKLVGHGRSTLRASKHYRQSNSGAEPLRRCLFAGCAALYASGKSAGCRIAKPRQIGGCSVSATKRHCAVLHQMPAIAISVTLPSGRLSKRRRC